MNVKVLLFMLLFVNTSLVYPDSPYRLYEAELIQSYKVGLGEGFLSRNNVATTPVGETTSNDINFDKNGILYVVDPSNRRIIIMDGNFLFKKQVDISKVGMFFYVDDIEIHDDGISANIWNQYFVKFSYTGELIYILPITSDPDNHFRYKNSIFYISDNSRNIYLASELTTDKEENDEKWMKAEDVEKLFQVESEKRKLGFMDLNIQDGYLYQKNIPVLRNFNVFKKYWMEKHKREKEPAYLMKLDGRSVFDFGGFEYIGIDKDYNTYWFDMGYMHVFDRNGWLIDGFAVNTNIGNRYIAIHPSGDVYYLVFYENDAKLYRIKRVWGIDKTSTNKKLPPSATLNDSYVRLRDAPNLSSNKIGTLMKDDKVEILDQTTEKMKIGDMESVWYW